MQQINLYLPEFRPKRDWLTFNLSVIYVGALVACMLGYQLIVWRSEQHWRERVTDAETQSQTLAEEVAQLKSKPASQSREAYEQKTAQLRATIANREALAQVIGGQAFGNRQGFSQYFRAISENWLEGIALTEFGLTHGGQFATLSGEATQAELVPLFIGGLRADAVFADARFGLLSLQDSGEGTITFTTQGQSGEDRKPRAKRDMASREAAR